MRPGGSLFRIVSGNELGLQHFRYGERQFFPERRLPEYAIVCCFSGHIDVWEDSCLKRLTPGEILIANPGVVRGSLYAPELGVCEGATAIANPKLMHEIMVRMRLAHEGCLARFSGKIQDAGLVSEMRNACRKIDENRAGTDIFLDGFLRQFLVETLWRWPPANTLPLASSAEPYLPRRHFVSAAKFMNRCSRHQFSVQHLCGEIGVSLPHFRRLLHASSGASPLSSNRNEASECRCMDE